MRKITKVAASISSKRVHTQRYFQDGERVIGLPRVPQLMSLRILLSPTTSDKQDTMALTNANMPSVAEAELQPPAATGVSKEMFHDQGYRDSTNSSLLRPSYQ